MFFFDHLENSFLKKSSVLLEPVLSFGAVGEALTYYCDFTIPEEFDEGWAQGRGCQCHESVAVNTLHFAS